MREGRSFNPDEFAIAPEEVVAGRAPEDYQDPLPFVSCTWFTCALCEISDMARRLSGRTNRASPVQTLVTQIAGGKTHRLTAPWHLSPHCGERVIAARRRGEAPSHRAFDYLFPLG